MNRLNGMISAAVFSILMESGASAATVICEGGGPGPDNGDTACTGILGDFSNSTADPVFILDSDTEFRGGIAATYADGWTLNLGATTYTVTISAVTVGSQPFTGDFTIGGQTVSVDGSGTTVSLVGLFTGIQEVLLDATAGRASWQVNLTAVPLPASGLMLLATLGAAGYASRRKKS